MLRHHRTGDAAADDRDIALDVRFQLFAGRARRASEPWAATAAQIVLASGVGIEHPP